MNITESILIIDDNLKLRQTLAAILQKEGYAITTSENSNQALHALRAGPYDLVILDIKMPGINGSQLLPKIRDLYPEMPVVILTGHATVDSAIIAVRYGARDYLIKPIDPPIFLSRVQEIIAQEREAHRHWEIIDKIHDLSEELRETDQANGTINDISFQERYPHPDQVLKRGPFTLYLQEGRTLFEGQTLDITPTTFNYLIVLIQRALNIVSPEILVMEAQGYDLTRTEAVLLARGWIHKLRKAIEADPKKPQYIITVRGFGYRMAI